MSDYLEIKNNNRKGYQEAFEGDSVSLQRPTSSTRRGRVGNQVAQTLDTSPTMGVVVKCNELGKLGGKYEKMMDISRRVYGIDGLSPSIHTCQGGNQEPKIGYYEESLFTETQAKMFTEDGNVKRYIDSDVVDEFKEDQVADISFPNGYNKGKRVHDECPSINTATTQSSFCTKTSTLRIRKLTPKECWRLMGFDDTDFEKAQAVPTSNSQLYKQAGNSIVVQCLEEIFKELLI